MVAETVVVSFVIRFVRRPGPEAGPIRTAWHGVIRHVQSNQTQRFLTLEEAIAFMGRYVSLSGVTVPEEAIDSASRPGGHAGDDLATEGDRGE